MEYRAHQIGCTVRALPGTRRCKVQRAASCTNAQMRSVRCPNPDALTKLVNARAAQAGQRQCKKGRHEHQRIVVRKCAQHHHYNVCGQDRSGRIQTMVMLYWWRCTAHPNKASLPMENITIFNIQVFHCNILDHRITSLPN